MKQGAVWFVVLGMLALAAPQRAYAQAKQGDKEVQAAGNVFSVLSSGSSLTNGQFQFGVGYFLTDRLEIAVTPVVSITGTKQTTPTFNSRGQIIGSSSTTNVDADMGVSTNMQYFFGASSSKVKPYVGTTFIVESFKTGDGGSLADNTFLGANAGVKNYFTDRAALDLGASFGFRPNAPSDFQLLRFNIGITYLF